MKKAVVLLSGGIDSTVAAYIARRDIGKKGGLYALTFNYGQLHQRELDSAKVIGEDLNICHDILDLPLNRIVESALVGKGEIPTERSQAMKQTFGLAYGPSKERLEALEGEGIPSTWVPQRNSIFLALAFAYAETVGANLVYTGFNVKDYSGYPDCRPEFVDQIQRALNLASKQFVETGKGIGIICPLMHLHKHQIIRMGIELGVDFSKTWSCYKGEEKACGVCPSCRIRLEAYKEVGLVDPIEYG